MSILLQFHLCYFMLVEWQPISLELGGKSPIIVFEDGDLNNG